MKSMRSSIKTTLAILFLSASSLAVVVIDPWLKFNNSAEQLWLNILPVIFLVILIYGLFRRTFISVLLTLLVLILLFSINTAKLNNLNEPLLFGDFLLFKQVTAGWALMAKYTEPWVYVIVVLVLLVSVLLCKFERPSMAWRYGVIPAILSILGFHLLLLQDGIPNLNYSVWNNKAVPWEFNELAKKQGLIASLVVGGQMYRQLRPSFSADVIDDFLAVVERPAGLPAIDSKPDIVLWLSESFFDPSILNNVDSCEVLPNWCALQQQGLAAYMRVNAFGGGTIRTEFEVLTGVPMPVMQGYDFPYISYVNTPTTSIAWRLKKSGYSTLAVHPHKRNFWSRARALPLLGFDDFEAEEAFKNAPRVGYYISDKVLTDHVIAHLNTATQPSFIMAISMENHGPWGARINMDEERLAAISAPTALDNELVRTWQEYFFHGENAVAELERLYRYIKTRERPTLVVFFGDHLPGIMPVFESLGFKDKELGVNSPLPVLALANYPLTSGWRPNNAYGLGVWTLQLAGQLGENNFYQMNTALLNRNNHTKNAIKATEALSEMQVRQLYSTPTH